MDKYEHAIQLCASATFESARKADALGSVPVELLVLKTAERYFQFYHDTVDPEYRPDDTGVVCHDIRMALVQVIDARSP